MTTGAMKWAMVPLSLAGIFASAPAFAEQAGDGRAVTQTQLSQAFRAPTQEAPQASGDPARLTGSTTAPPALKRVGPDSLPPEVRAIFVGATGGLAYASFKHSALSQGKLVGPMISFQVGYRITEAWALSVVYTDFQRAVARNSGSELFGAATSLFHTQADCLNCKDPIPGGDVLATTFRLSTLGPAVDVTPFGKNGPFLGASGGLAMAVVTGTSYGYAGTARAGLRLRPVDNVSLGVEGGVQGQKFDAGSALISYGAAEMRLSF